MIVFNNETIKNLIMDALNKWENGIEVNREELIDNILKYADRDFGIDNDNRTYTEEELQNSNYIHINEKEDNKSYVGQTKRKPKERWKNRYIKQYFGIYIKENKYDWEKDLAHIVLCYGLTKEEADEMEIALIAILKCTDKQYGYNVANGGSSFDGFSDEIREKLKENNPMAKKVCCSDLMFRSLAQCAEYYDKNQTTMADWIRGDYQMHSYFKEKNLHFATEEEVNSNLYEKYDPNIHGEKCKDFIIPVINGTFVFCGGLIFETLKQCAEYYDKNQTTMADWIRGDYQMHSYFKEKNLHFATEEEVKTYDMYDPNIHGEKCNDFIMPVGKGTFVFCGGLIFETISQCERYFSVVEGSMKRWLNKNKSTENSIPIQFQELGLRYATEEDVKTYDMYNSDIHGEIYEHFIIPVGKGTFIFCNGIIFETISQCAEYYGIPLVTMCGWLIKNSIPSQFQELGLRYAIKEDWLKYEIYNKDIHGEKAKDFIRILSKNAKKCVNCNGINFKSMGQCERYFSIKKGKMKGWFKYNSVPPEFQELGLRLATGEDLTTYDMYNPNKHGETYEDYIASKKIA